MTTAVLTPTSEPLKATDRCDRCGAPAYVRVLLGGGELLFCAHHGKKYNESLSKVALEIHDFSDALLAEERTKATSAADDR